MGRKFFKALTFREMEYLEFVKSKNVVVYQEVIESLKQTILGPHAPPCDGYPMQEKMADQHPLYPPLAHKEGKRGQYDVS